MLQRFNQSHVSQAGTPVALLLLLLLVACQSSPPRTDTSSPTALSSVTSVKPGINDAFLQPNLNLNEWVTRFEGESREVFQQRLAIVHALPIPPGSEVADIGAGTGLFTPLLANATGEEGLVFAVDIAPDFVAYIDERVAKAGLNQVITVLCTDRSVELPDDSIDLAFLCDVYHHFEFPGPTLASIHRALRQNGDLVLIDFKRIPDESSEWLLNHVRAGQEVFTREIEEAGFVKVEEYPILSENYMLRFKKR